MSIIKCPLCSSPSSSNSAGEELMLRLECPRCGEYEIYCVVIDQLGDRNFSDLQKANMSGWMREHSLKISSWEEMKYLISISDKTPTVGQKAEKLLLYLSKKYSIFGEWTTTLNGTPEFLGASWAQNEQEFRSLVEDYLDKRKHFLKRYSISSREYKITLEGWAYIENLRYANSESQIGFIAMWFDESVNFLLTDVIGPAVEAAGYNPLPINKHEHINRIDDEILAMIRRSKFVVADFTGQRGGVYFESGFALGLGLPVFWLCEKKEIDDKKMHFDVRQYKFICWERDKLTEAKKSLQFSIESILGRGKYISASGLPERVG